MIIQIDTKKSEIKGRKFNSALIVASDEIGHWIEFDFESSRDVIRLLFDETEIDGIPMTNENAIPFEHQKPE